MNIYKETEELLEQVQPKLFIIRSILVINILVFICWSLPSEDIFIFMANHFLISWNSLTEGRLWTLVTSAFSHNLFIHLLLNMFVLKSFGNIMEMALGPWRLLKFYLLAAIASSFGHAFVSYFLLNDTGQPALGASGAISGLVLLFALSFPKQKIYLLGFIPLPAIWGALAFMALDIWGVVSQATGRGLPIGHGAHLGGALFGVFYYFLFIRKKLSHR